MTENEASSESYVTSYYGFTKGLASHSRLLQGVSNFVSSSSLLGSSIPKHRRDSSDASTETFLSVSEDASLSSSLNASPASKGLIEQAFIPTSSKSCTQHNNLISDSIVAVSNARTLVLKQQQLEILDQDLEYLDCADINSSINIDKEIDFHCSPKKLNLGQTARISADQTRDIVLNSCEDIHTSPNNNEEIDFPCYPINLDLGTKTSLNSTEHDVNFAADQNPCKDEQSRDIIDDSRRQELSDLRSSYEFHTASYALLPRKCTSHSTSSTAKSESPTSSPSTESIRSPLSRKLQLKLLQASPNDQFDAIAVTSTTMRVPCSLLDAENRSLSSSSGDDSSSFNLVKATLSRNSSAPSSRGCKFRSNDLAMSVSEIDSTSSSPLPRARLFRAGSAPTFTSTRSSFNISRRTTRKGLSKSKKKRKKKKGSLDVSHSNSLPHTDGKASIPLPKPSFERIISDASCVSRNTTRSSGPVDVDTVIELYGDDSSTSSKDAAMIDDNMENKVILERQEPKANLSVVSLINDLTAVSSTMYGRKPLQASSPLVARRSLGRSTVRGTSYSETSRVGGPVDVDDFIPVDSYYLYDRHYIILDEREFSRGLAGYEVGFEPEVIWDYESYKARRRFSDGCVPQAIREEEDDDEEGNKVVLARDIKQTGKGVDEYCTRSEDRTPRSERVSI